MSHYGAALDTRRRDGWAIRDRRNHHSGTAPGRRSTVTSRRPATAQAPLAVARPPADRASRCGARRALARRPRARTRRSGFSLGPIADARTTGFGYPAAVRKTVVDVVRRAPTPRRRTARGLKYGAPAVTEAPDSRLVQPVSLLELARKVLLGEVLEILVGEGVQLVFEAAREHPLDLFLPALLLEPRVAEELSRAGDVLVVELDAHVARQPVRFGVRAREPDELGLWNRHALALEGEVDRALLDDGVNVVTPGVVVHEDIDGELLLLVQPPGQTPDAVGRLPVSGQENAVVPPPELVLGQPVPLGALLDEEDEIGRAFLDLEVLRLDNGGHEIPAFPELRAVHPVAVVHQDQGADDGASVLGTHVQLLAESRQRHLQVLDERIGLVLGVERVLVRVLDRVLGPVVDLAKRGREVGSLQLAERIGHEDRLHELLGHADVEERPGLLSLPHLDQAPALVEGDVGQGPDGDRERGVLSPLGRGDHHVGHADELLLDRRHAAGLAGHRSPLGLPARRATRRRAFALGPALGLSGRPRPGSGRWVCFRGVFFRGRAVGRHGVVRRVARQHRDLTLDAVRRDDDRVRKTFRATSVPPHELVGLFAAGPPQRHLLQLLLQLRGRQSATLEAIARVDDLLDVQLEDVAPAELAVGPFAAPEKGAQPPAAFAQRQRDLLPDLVVIGDRLLRFAGEGDPHGSHVDEDHHRAAGKRASGLRHAVVAPRGVEHRLVDRAGGLLMEERHAVGVADDAGKLAVVLLLLALGHGNGLLLLALRRVLRAATEGQARLDHEGIPAVDRRRAAHRRVEVAFDLLIQPGQDRLLPDRREEIGRAHV